MHFKAILFLFSIKTLGFVSSGDFALIQIANNTLSQMKDLKEILTETRSFGEEFERINSQVQTKTWQADRLAMYMEDLKNVQGVEIENLSDFNYALSRLKNSNSNLKRLWKELEREKKESKRLSSHSDKDYKNTVRRLQRFQNDSFGTITPANAQVETAKNTKDMLVELSRQNLELVKMKKEMAKISLELKRERQEKLERELRLREMNGFSEKGVLRRNYVEVKR